MKVSSIGMEKSTIERMPDMLAHSGGTCWKNYIHYAQIIRDKRF
jgi:hypothetical protein